MAKEKATIQTDAYPTRDVAALKEEIRQDFSSNIFDKPLAQGTEKIVKCSFENYCEVFKSSSK